MRAAGEVVKQQLLDAAKSKLASYSADGASSSFVQGLTSRIPLSGVADRVNTLLSSKAVQTGMSLADKAWTAKNAVDGTLQDLAAVRDRVGAVYDYGKAVAERDAGQGTFAQIQGSFDQSPQIQTSDQAPDQGPPPEIEVAQAAPAA